MFGCEVGVLVRGCEPIHGAFDDPEAKIGALVPRARAAARGAIA